MVKGAATKAMSISKLLGAAPVLPGESAAQYQASLQCLMEELEAKTVLQVYLAEKMHECLWWVRRYEAQKRATIVAEMAALVSKSGNTQKITALEAHVCDLLATNQSDGALLNCLKASKHTLESLQQSAITYKAIQLQGLDQQIALQTKILASLQASYEVTTNRKLATERLQLQNDLMRRDLQSLDLPPAQVVVAAPDGTSIGTA